MKSILLNHKKLWLWLGAKQLSDISTSLNTIVIGLYALELLDSPAALGFVLGLRMIGSVVGASFTPVVSRFIKHRIILVVSEFSSAALILILALTPTSLHPALLLLLPAFIGFSHGIFHVSLYSQAKNFIGFDNRHIINNLLASIDGVAVVAGGILASVLYGTISVNTIFIFDAATFVISGVAFLYISQSYEGSLAKGLSHKNSRAKNIIAIKTFIFSLVPLAGGLFVARFIEAFGSSTHNIGLPIISSLYLPENPAFLIGWITASWGIGKIISTIITIPLASKLKTKHVSEITIFKTFLISTFILFLGVFISKSLLLILLFSFLAGIFDAGTETFYYAILQGLEDVKTDSIISASYFVERSGMGLGILICGFAFNNYPPEAVATALYLTSISICLILIINQILRKSKNLGEQV